MSKNDNYIADAKASLGSYEPTNIASAAYWKQAWIFVESNDGRWAFDFAKRAEFCEFELPYIGKG
jgi:hypothetical protein